MALATGQSFGNYQIVKLLGQGGQGEVYLAKDVRLDRSVAIKILGPALVENPEFLARFRREAKLCASLSHPGICTIHEIGQVNGQTYICMEYIEGRNLRELTQQSLLSLEQTLDIAIQIADAMEEARKKNIIHRDIKSANIVLTSRGTVKILDFGLAKRLHNRGALEGTKQDTESSITQFGTVRGTIAYMAPEQALAKEVDHRSDIFSFGVVLYEMLTGHLPFTGESITEVVDSILHNEPAPMKKFQNDIPDSMVRVVNKMLEKDPDKRYQSVHEVWVDLRKIRSQLVPEHSSPRTLEYLPSHHRKKFVRLILPLMIVVLLSGLIFLFLRYRTGQPAGASKRKGVPVAVLPFVYKGETDRAYLASLVTDGLIAALQPNESVSVAPYATVREFEKETSISQLFKNLNVDWIIRGTVSADGEQIVITPEILSSAEKTSVWKQNIHGGSIEAVDRAAIEILKVLPISSRDTQMLGQIRTPNVQAYQTYLKARDIERGWDVESNLDQAIALYQQALKLDPDFAAAHAGLAAALLTEFRKRNEPQLLSQASDASRHALALDPRLPEALLAYGAVQLQSGNSVEAQEAFARALQFAPGDDAACRHLASIYAAAGRYGEARQMYERAIALRPSFWTTHYAYGTFHWQYAGDLKAARASFEKATELHPNGFAPVVMLGNLHLLQGNLEDAEIYFRKSLELSPNPYAYNNLGLIHYYRGQYDLALRNWQSLLKEAPDKPSYRANVADALRQLKRSEEADAQYQQAIQAFRKMLAANEEDDTTRSYMSMALAATGYCAEAIRETRKVVAKHADSPELNVYAAITASRCGELDWAHEIVLRSIDSDNLLTIRYDPDLERIRQRPDIRSALQRSIKSN